MRKTINCLEKDIIIGETEGSSLKRKRMTTKNVNGRRDGILECTGLSMELVNG